MQCDNCGKEFHPTDLHYYLVEHEQGKEGVFKWVFDDVPHKKFDTRECIAQYLAGGKPI